jgi:hypothetical protein
MDTQQVESLTGFRPDAHHPVVPASPIELTAEQLPIRFNFKGRKYIVLMTKNNRLVMNGATE